MDVSLGVYTLAIHQLPESLANKIAAGEVVERPASVVKELIENSIDANSTMIKIELTEAGLSEIKVTDNGDGMSESDCKKAFLRHATSKITYDTDLFHIKSLGFRGEALASIASVSKLTIKSSEGTKASTILVLEGGNIVEQSKGDARKGTEITVENLFYNTPARLKYMKSIHTELGHITDLTYRYALAQPNIRFDVFHNGKNIFTSSGSGNMLQVIGQIYGMQIARNMLPIQSSTTDFDIEGFIAKPEVTRSNRNFMTIIVNGRYIKSLALNYAIIRAFDTLLPRHRYPVVVLSITLDPILVDVNVHPTKLEVRFSKEKELVQAIEQAIQEKLRQLTLIPSITYESKEKKKVEQHTLTFNEDNEDVSTDQQTGNRMIEDREYVSAKNVNDKLYEPSTRTENMSDHPIDLVELEKKDTHAVGKDEKKSTLSKEESNIRVPILYPIGQYRGTYILAQNEDGFYMIDQHAAQERIKYEFFKEKLGKPESELQQLLFPLTFEFTKSEIVYIDNHKDKLETIGLFLEPFGGNTYAVRSYPTWFPEGMEEDIIRDMVTQIIQNEQVNIEKMREEVAILMSCKRSIKANHYLSEQEMITLLNDLQKTKDPFTCPHGRPVIIQFTNYEIEKMFKRIM